ncbi:MAG: replication initiator protein A [Rhodospirillales bacterium]
MSDLCIYKNSEPPLRDLRDLMTYPFVAIQKGRTTPIEFKTKGISIKVTGCPDIGIATIWDFDFFIAACSFLNDADQSQPLTNLISFRPTAVLECMGKKRTSDSKGQRYGGGHYQRLGASIRRLASTQVHINEEYSNASGLQTAFTFISWYRIPTSQGRPSPNAMWSVEIPKFVPEIVGGKKAILAVHPGYFTLKSSLAKGLYRIARKSVPEASGFFQWRIDTLKARLGATSSLPEFMRRLREIAKSDSLPEYSIRLLEKEPHPSLIFEVNRSKAPRPKRGTYHPSRSQVLASLTYAGTGTDDE